MPHAKITSAFLEKAKPDEQQERIIYWDTEIQGFGVRIGATSKTFICQKRVGSKKTKVVLGKFPAMTIQEARRRASETLVTLSSGVDVNSEKKNVLVTKGVTLRKAFEDYLTSHELKTSSVYQYRHAILNIYGDWADMPIKEISKRLVEERHLQIAKERGKQSANKFSRTLRAIINFAISKYEINGRPLLDSNPVSRLSETREWFEDRRKTGHIKPHLFPDLINAINKECKNDVLRDYLMFVLLTGCRRREASGLPWKDVDIRGRSFIVSASRSKTNRQLELPLTTQLMEIVERRHVERVNEWVFPSITGKGHIDNPLWTIKKIGDRIGQHFTVHDLRRTYITVADSLNISQYAVKALVNHSMSKSDVTAGYIQMSVERLREPMRQINDFILGQKDTTEISV